jgi:two-component system, NarL family, response regulator DesR
LNLPTALIADDNSEWRAAIARMLGPGYDVVCQIAHGDQVIASASRFKPDFVTLDISMPGTSGLKLLPRLRTLLPNATIVILSTNSDDLYIQEAYRRGADSYVLKTRAWRDLIPALESGRLARQQIARA